MPLYTDKIVEELEDRKEDLKSESIGDESLIEDYSSILKGLKQRLNLEQIKGNLKKFDYPGAIPSSEYKECDGFIVPFEESNSWNSHERVNRWAKQRLKGISTIGVDGSQINPTKEFDRPIGFVQVALINNKHEKGGSYERKIETELLTTKDLLTNEEGTEFVKLDEHEVHVRRFETETRLIREEIEKNANLDPPPMIFYDGSLLVWFIEHISPSKRERYGQAMGKLLAASKKHNVPLVGYVGGSKSTEIKSMIMNLGLINKSEKFLIHDYQFISPLMNNWGDRTILFNSLQSETLNTLNSSYQGEEYDFSEDIMFTYLKTGPGPQLDRIEMPRWIIEEDLLEYTMNMIRAESCVGRGFPEIIQQADADAVISGRERGDFLSLYQRFAEDNDIELRWNNKAKSKRRRRR